MLTAADVAALLAFSKRTVYDLARSGSLALFRFCNPMSDYPRMALTYDAPCASCALDPDFCAKLGEKSPATAATAPTSTPCSLTATCIACSRSWWHQTWCSWLLP
jgi:hypothetical protein